MKPQNIIFSIALALTFIQAASAQTLKPQENKTWVSIGADLAVHGSGTTLGIYHKRNKHLFGYRYTDIDRNQYFKLPLLSNVILDVLDETDYGYYKEHVFSYGRMASSKYFYATISGGISFLAGEKPRFTNGKQNGMITYSGVGLPLESQLYFTPTSWLALGTTIRHTFNQHEQISGISFGIQLGKFR